MSRFWKKTFLALLVFSVGCVINLLGIPQFMYWYLDQELALWTLPVVGFFSFLLGSVLILLALLINDSEVS